MKKNFLIILAMAALAGGCKKDDKNEVPSTDLEKEILYDFAHSLALENYADLKSKAAALNDAIIALDNQPDNSKLAAARLAWRNVRAPWEQCEGWLFGPVEDMSFDPEIDDWPVNHVDLDSLLAGSMTFDVAAIQQLQTTLKGFHPLEYMIYGNNGNKDASQLTLREREYMKALSLHLLGVTNQIYQSWEPGQPGNFSNEVISAGAGSQVYASRKDAFIAIVSAMAGICDEVANGKIQDPLVAQDSSLEESQFSKNSLIDFKNNMIGVGNAYYGKYSSDGKGINDWVASRNIALDNKIAQQINAAVNSFDNITVPFGQAIYSQQVQIANSQQAINNLMTTLQDELLPFVQNNMNE